MSAGPARGARVAAGFVWLALFSILYTAGDAYGLWPELPPGALKDLDLAVGAAGLALLGLWLLRRRSSP
jgi:hypothetical protein